MVFTQLPKLLPSVIREFNIIAQTKYTSTFPSNSPAPLVDHGDIHHIITRLSGTLVELDDAIGALLRCKSTLNGSLLHHSRLVSKLNIIPMEVMSSIFSHATEWIGVEEAHTPSRSIAQNFTQVCRRWREIAIATPFLWNLIKLDFGREKLASSLELLARSGSVPVYLTIFTPMSFEFLGQECEKTLCLFSRSCSAMEIAQSHEYKFNNSHAQKLVDAFPHLKMLTLSETSTYGMTLNRLQKLQHLSHLRLKFTSISLINLRAFMEARWGCLKSLIIDHTPAFFITESINASFPVLETLFVNADRIEVPISPSFLARHAKLCTLGIIVPYMEYSSLGKTTDTAVYRLLDQLDLPSLKTLVFPAISSQQLDRVVQYVRCLDRPLDNIELLIGSGRGSTVDESMVQRALPQAMIVKDLQLHRSSMLLDHYAAWFVEYVHDIPI